MLGTGTAHVVLLKILTLKTNFSHSESEARFLQRWSLTWYWTLTLLSGEMKTLEVLGAGAEDVNDLGTNDHFLCCWSGPRAGRPACQHLSQATSLSSQAPSTHFNEEVCSRATSARTRIYAEVSRPVGFLLNLIPPVQGLILKYYSHLLKSFHVRTLNWRELY